MKRAVRHENEMVSLEEHAKRRNQLAVERFQMALRSPQQRFFKSPHIAIAHAKLGDLEAQQL